MLKVCYEVSPGCKIEATCKDVQGVFKCVSYLSSLFGVKECGNCGSPSVSPKHKETKEGYNYYFHQCADCGHELKFGVRKEDGILFPKGWEAGYKKDNDGEDSPKKQQRQKETAGSRSKRTPDDDAYDSYESDNGDNDDIAF